MTSLCLVKATEVILTFNTEGLSIVNFTVRMNHYDYGG